MRLRSSKEPLDQVQEEETEMRVLVLAKEGERSDGAPPPTALVRELACLLVLPMQLLLLRRNSSR